MSKGPFTAEPLAQIRQAATLTDGDIIEVSRQYWRNSLEGLDLGEYDRRIIEWAARTCDFSTLWVLADLIERAREAGETGR